MKLPSSELAVVSLRTTCIPETVRFYQDVVGLSGMTNHGHHPAFELGNGAYLVIVGTTDEVPSKAQSPRFPLLAFAVPDLDQSVQRLKDNRVDLPWGIESSSQARWVEFYDPAGNLIELAQFVR